MNLIFKKNRLLTFTSNMGALCAGIENSRYPKSVILYRMKTFKDSEEQEYRSCPYRKWYGPSGVRLSDFTEKEYSDWEKQYWQCWHPSLLETISEWRCYKCNATVKSINERHNCYNPA